MSSPKSLQHPVGEILRRLLNEANIKESELARQVNLPQTTINRLLLGGTLDPRAHTLKPIADFFGITIGQLCGFEPLPPNRITGSTQPILRSAWTFIPIIAWEEVNAWLFMQHNITPHNHQYWIGTERVISENAYALYSLPSMEPRFRKGSILIVDPKALFKDGHFIIMAFDGIHPTVRKVIKDGQNILLQPFDQTQSSTQLTKAHRIFGTIVESRLDIYND